MNIVTRTSLISALRQAAYLLRAGDDFDRDAVKVANRTSRGAMGAKALTPWHTEDSRLLCQEVG